MTSARRTPVRRVSASLFASIACAAAFASFTVFTTAHASEQDAARHRIGTSRSQSHTDRAGDQPITPALTRAQANLKSTQDLMAKIRKTSDPAERRVLLQQHSLAMRANLDEVRSLLKESDDAPDVARSNLDLMSKVLDQMAEHQKIEDETGSTK